MEHDGDGSGGGRKSTCIKLQRIFKYSQIILMHLCYVHVLYRVCTSRVYRKSVQRETVNLP